jgi:hypothetical protein
MIGLFKMVHPLMPGPHVRGRSLNTFLALGAADPAFNRRD